MFEALIREVAVRFELGDKARDLLAALLATLFDEHNGGLAGMAAKFRQRGLEDVFRSWVGDASPRTINVGQVEDVLGADEISRMAQRLDLTPDLVAAAATVMLPTLIRLVTPNGELPRGMPAGVNGYLGNAGAAPGVTHVKALAATPHLGGLKWPLLAALVLALGYCVLHREPQPGTPAPTQSAAPSSAAAPGAATSAIASNEPTLALVNATGQLQYSGMLGSEAEKARIEGLLSNMFGANNVHGRLDVDTQIKAAAWLDALGGMLPYLLSAKGARLDIEGRTITLGGPLSDADRATLGPVLKALFGGYTLRGID
jgi:uncharacterized protein YidB (DUF937 family)